MILETQRLFLREMTLSDLDALLLVLGDAESMRYYPKPFDREMVQKWIDRHRHSYTQHGVGLWAMVLKATGEVIGDCGLVWQEVEGHRELEIGYHVRRDQQMQGYATEAAYACQDYAFNVLGSPRVISLIRPENIPSRRVAEKNGLKVVQKTLWRDIPHYIYAVQRSESKLFATSNLAETEKLKFKA
ncbi:MULTISPECIES: GNAT family N-acetyltransferase [unclassified Nostoc]|uniref:GNAT family N-acetyltransferase n=1 Tax=unclassified Nostoc TaxID=2593658 RepID=UPI002AD5B0FA|nr:GNAT family N-acetyltransferase [Nostoc sp. DedQUE03]MDZ7976121.1 GNAT family N-acetyltransferase [Nostoc sp. DedQUE03]MDZ8044097.1 GNAT family N-acetyltransferase [Nostoc sp. DedQUE02]